MHRGHSIKHIRDVRPQVTKKSKELEDALEECQKYEHEVLSAIEEEKQYLYGVVQGHMWKLRDMINDKEKALLWEIDVLVGAKRDRIERFLKEDRLVTEIIKERIGNFKAENINKQYIDDLLCKVPTSLAKIDFILMSNYNKIFNFKDFADKLGFFQATVGQEIEKLQHTFTSQDFITFMDNNYVERRQGEEVLNLRQFISFDKAENKLVIALQNSLQTGQVPIGQFKDVNEVLLNFTSYQLLKKRKIFFNWIEIRLLFDHLCESLSQVQKLTIKFQAGAFTPEELEILISCNFFKRKDVRVTVEMSSLDDSQAKSGAIIEIFRDIIPKIALLSGLYLDVGHKMEATDKVIEELDNYNSARLKNMERLELILMSTPITDSSISQLLNMWIPSLKVFTLDVSKTCVSNKTLEVMAAYIFTNLKNIEDLKLNFTGTEISDAGGVLIFQEAAKMPSLKKLKLWLTNTKVSDKTVEAFAKNCLPSMGNLEQFKVNLTSTTVTDLGVSQLMVAMHNLKVFSLHLQATKISDKTIEAFVANTLPTLTKLEDFGLTITDTPTSNLKVLQAMMTMKPVDKFTLYLNNNVTVYSHQALEETYKENSRGFFKKMKDKLTS